MNFLNKRFSIDFVFIFMLYEELKNFNKCNPKIYSMRHILISFCVVLALFSCSKYVSVTQINTKNTAVTVGAVEVDPVAESLIKPFRDSIEHDMKKFVCKSASPLVKGKPESKLTNLVTDIILDYAKEFCAAKRTDVHPDAAYVNYGGLRASLPQGEITVGHIFELMPFENEIVLIKISGEAVQKMAAKIAGRGGEGVANLKIGLRKNEVGTLLIGNKPVDPGASYWLATNDYIANGGDQMSMFINPIEKIETKAKIRDILIRTLTDRYKKSGIIDVKEDGRIYNEQ